MGTGTLGRPMADSADETQVGSGKNKACSGGSPHAENKSQHGRQASCIASEASLSGSPPGDAWDRWRGCSSDGRALQSHCRGQGFDSPQLHQPPDRKNPTFFGLSARRRGGRLNQLGIALVSQTGVGMLADSGPECPGRGDELLQILGPKVSVVGVGSRREGRCLGVASGSASSALARPVPTQHPQLLKLRELCARHSF